MAASRIEEIAQIATLTERYMSSSETVDGSCVAVIIDLMCQLVSNAFTIADAEMRPIGLGVFPSIALFNHSCQPNCTTVFTGNVLHVRAITNVQKGDELTVSYIDLADTAQGRRTSLSTSYFFECDCPKCEEDDPRLGGVICRECKDGFMAGNPLVCLSCSAVSPPPHLERVNNPSLSQLKAAVVHESSLLHPFNTHLVATKSALLAKLIAEGSDWPGATALCGSLIPAYRTLYPNSPLLGLQLLTLGKLRWFQRDAIGALRALEEARDVLTVTHGGSHNVVVHELEPLLLQAKAEAMIQK